jgi:hypothetical protein
MSMHPDRNLFKEFKGNHTVFCETGSYRGSGIQLALDAGFKNIISIDIDPANIDFCMNRFDLYRGIDSPDADIQLFCGDSALCLGELLKDINEPCMFWLDAHAQHLEGEELGENPFPLMMELQQIQDRGIPGSTIIIDDILHLTHEAIVPWKRHEIQMMAMLAVQAGRNAIVQTQMFANPVKDSIMLCRL